MEPRHRQGRPPVSAGSAAQGVPSQDRHAVAGARGAGRTRHLGSGMAGERIEMAAECRGSRIRRVADGPRRGARQVRRLDRAAGDRHQSPAGRFRIRAVQLTIAIK